MFAFLTHSLLTAYPPLTHRLLTAYTPFGTREPEAKLCLEGFTLTGEDI